MPGVVCEKNNRRRNTSRVRRINAMLRAGNEIHLLMKDTNKKLKVSQGLPDWKAYLDFVNNIVVGGSEENCSEELRRFGTTTRSRALGEAYRIRTDVGDRAGFD